MYKMSAYPITKTVEDGHEIVIRPMTPGDEAALLAFFLRLPEEERYYLKEDVTSPEVVRQWSEHLNYSRALPLLALDADRVVADGTLHRRRAGARKHIGEIRVVVDGEYRNKGVGTALMHELIEIARDSDLELLTFELVADEQDAAIRTSEALGFTRIATLPNHVRDIKGKPHDLLIMGLPLGKWLDSF
jgi:RimJ/RimL family protein N-acetyltransferase